MRVITGKRMGRQDFTHGRLRILFTGQNACWCTWMPRYGGHRWQTECPHVVYRDGYYYLFRTVHYASAETYVFSSENPMDFGIGDASEKYVGRIAVAAPEIIVTDDGNTYITSNHNLAGGTMVCRLRWKVC